MARISDLSEELLVKILSYLPTKVAISTSVLSKQWECLWLWLPKLEYNYYHVNNIFDDPDSFLRFREFVAKYLPLHRAPIIESLSLKFCSPLQPEYIKLWAGIAVSRGVRELSIDYYKFDKEPAITLPICLYTCKSLVTLKPQGSEILVDVPPMGSLPSLKTLELEYVTYSNEDALPLLLSYCPVLEDLTIERDDDNDNLRALVVIVPSLLRLSLMIDDNCSSDGYVVIDTPSLKYFKVRDDRRTFSNFIEHMPKLEEANIDVMDGIEKHLKSVTTVKRLTVTFNVGLETEYSDGIVFNQLKNLKLCIFFDDWSKLLVQLLKDSPKLRVLNLDVDEDSNVGEYDEPFRWRNNLSSVPKCLSKSLEAFEFAGYEGRREERGFLSFIFKYACRLKSSSVLR